MSVLPTPAQMLDHADAALGRAYEALGDAADWLRSDWPPGSEMTHEQAARRDAMFKAIRAAKGAINDTRGQL